MLKCPICEDALSVQTPDGWQCACGEMIPFGLEIGSEESCETCPLNHYLGLRYRVAA